MSSRRKWLVKNASAFCEVQIVLDYVNSKEARSYSTALMWQWCSFLFHAQISTARSTVPWKKATHCWLGQGVGTRS